MFFRKKKVGDFPSNQPIKHKELGATLESIMSKNMNSLANNPTPEHVGEVEHWLDEIYDTRTKRCYEYVYGLYAHILIEKGLYEEYRGERDG